MSDQFGFSQVGEMVKKHPVAVIGGGIALFVVIYLFMGSGSSTSTTSTSTASSAMTPAQEAQLALQMASIHAQQSDDAAQMAAVNNQTLSQLKLGLASLQTQTNIASLNAQQNTQDAALQANIEQQGIISNQAIAQTNAEIQADMASMYNNTAKTLSENALIDQLGTAGLGSLTTLGVAGVL